MNIEVKCFKCGGDLDIKDARNPMNGLHVIIEVMPCVNMKCYDCSKCEDSKENDSLNRQIEDIRCAAEPREA